MAALLRSAKSASDWTVYDLQAYNIKVSLFPDPQIFYGSSYPTVEILTGSNSNIDPGLLSSTLSTKGLSPETRRLLQYLDLSSRANSDQESTVHDFAKEILCALGYQDPEYLLRTRYAIPLSINGDPNRSAQIDVGLVHGPSSLIVMLVVQVQATVDPDPQVIASAIAAFQYNNRIRSRLGKPELNSTKFPCIAMIGTRPIICVVPVTEELSEAVLAGQYPASQTVVNKCVVVSNSGRLNEDMESPDFRQVAIRHFHAFRKFVWDHWRNASGKDFQ